MAQRSNKHLVIKRSWVRIPPGIEPLIVLYPFELLETFHEVNLPKGVEHKMQIKQLVVM